MLVLGPYTPVNIICQLALTGCKMIYQFND